MGRISVSLAKHTRCGYVCGVAPYTSTLIKSVDKFLIPKDRLQGCPYVPAAPNAHGCNWKSLPLFDFISKNANKAFWTWVDRGVDPPAGQC